MVFFISRALHLLFMALWFGSILKGLMDSITVAGAKFSGQRAESRYNAIVEWYGTIAGVGALASGFWLVEVMGGWEAVSPAISHGAIIAIIMALIAAFGVGRGHHRLTKATKDKAGAVEIKRLAKNLAITYGVLTFLWLSVFGLMALRHLVV